MNLKYILRRKAQVGRPAVCYSDLGVLSRSHCSAVVDYSHSRLLQPPTLLGAKIILVDRSLSRRRSQAS